MEPHRHFCFDICNHLVNKYHEECGTFVSCTVTNDKTLIHHYKPECKCQEYGMKTPDVTSLKEVQIPTNIGKSFVNNVLEFASNNPWVLSGIINSACYSGMLHDKLKLVAPRKCQGQLSKGVILLDDNAHSHTAAHFWNTPAAISNIRIKFHQMQLYFLMIKYSLCMFWPMIAIIRRWPTL
jgi:hypothetical protein